MTTTRTKKELPEVCVFCLYLEGEQRAKGAVYKCINSARDRWPKRKHSGKGLACIWKTLKG